MHFSSQLVEEAVNEIAKLPGIGKKTALRLAMHLLKEDPEATVQLSQALVNLRTRVRYCTQCHDISDAEICSICTSPRRDKSLICVVEDFPDVMAIENTAQYRGLYHVLGGVISPVEGIGPDELHIQSLIDRVEKAGGEVQEVILALSATMEADTTCFYITKRLSEQQVKVTSIARGVPVGGELEYTDEITLGRSILGRTPFQGT